MQRQAGPNGVVAFTKQLPEPHAGVRGAQQRTALKDIPDAARFQKAAVAIVPRKPGIVLFGAYDPTKQRDSA